MPDRSSSPTAPSWAPSAYGARSPRTPGSGSCATPTPATSRRSTLPAAAGSRCRCSIRPVSETGDTNPARAGGVRSVALRDAAQVLLPPEPGLSHLRGAQLNAQTLEPGSLSLRDGRIAALADDPLAELAVDCSGCAVLPGFVDCHTHLPFAGWREREYEQKLAGVPYEEIARSGGGIRASARALRDATDEQVLGQAQALAAELLAHGTT